MEIPLSILNVLNGTFDPHECMRNLRRIVCDPFADIDRVSVVCNEDDARLRTPAFSLSSSSRDLLPLEAVDTTMTASGAIPHADDHVWPTSLAILVRSMDSSLDAYDMQCARACVAGAHRVGTLLFWRSPGRVPIDAKRRRRSGLSTQESTMRIPALGDHLPGTSGGGSTPVVAGRAPK